MIRVFKFTLVSAVLGLLAFGTWKVLDFTGRLHPGAYTDEYPNRTDLLFRAAAKAGPGTYDLSSVYGEISAICISFAGVDPRQLAANALNKDLVELQGRQPFFTLEGVVTIIVFDREGKFRIEEFDKDVLFFPATGPIRDNTCVNRPSVARMTVASAEGGLSLAKLAATIDLK